ncbi:MAG: NAD(P)/FAD-dependent oxidoreductase [Armatimonadetes bacterium]|nr:NAD(P)/FAD-dependent oxidoreductase [Armatimonadota bacterium]
MEEMHQVVVIGGGFGGLNTVRALKQAPVSITWLDQRNFHLFQPLLYQVATGGLSPGNIASPLRNIVKSQRNTRVLLAKVTDIVAPNRQVVLDEGGKIDYDTLVIATGAHHHYFGNEHWAEVAPGLKTIEDAIEIRRRVLFAFEAAEMETDPREIRAWLTFVIIGGGPTGIELAGSLGEIANDTLEGDFRSINTHDARILLIEGMDRILGTFPPELSSSAVKALSRLGVTARTGCMVTDIQPDSVTIKCGDRTERIETHTVLWGAGVQASPLGRRLAESSGARLDSAGRVIVEPDLTVEGHPEIFVIGDLAHFGHQTGKPLPGTASVAVQQGQYAARLIRERLRGRALPPFHFVDRGTMATVGRAAAVADLPGIRLTGYLGWLVWLFVHLINLVEFEDRLLVLIQWAWNYFTRNRGARLITGEAPAKKSEKIPVGVR